MLQAYTQSAATLNPAELFLRVGMQMNLVHGWTLSFTDDKASKYREMANRISDALDFMNASGLTSSDNHEMRTVDFYASHEALLLEYEEALTRMNSTTEIGCWFWPLYLD